MPFNNLHLFLSANNSWFSNSARFGSTSLINAKAKGTSIRTFPTFISLKVNSSPTFNLSEHKIGNNFFQLCKTTSGSFELPEMAENHHGMHWNRLHSHFCWHNIRTTTAHNGATDSTETTTKIGQIFSELLRVIPRSIFFAEPLNRQIASLLQISKP